MRRHSLCAASARSSGVAPFTKSTASAAAEAIAPLLSGRIVLDAKFEGQVASDDTVFVTVRTPDDPNGLPLAQIRVEVSNLPFDFDIGTKEMLIGALRKFEGTLLFVSHDRHFLSELSTRVLELTPEGPHLYGGGYTEYVARTGHEAPGLH